MTLDPARQEAGFDQQRPEIARIVVALVLVHLLGRAQVEPKRGQLEEALAAPTGDVEEADAAGAKHAVKGAQRVQWSREVLEHRDAEHDVERVVLDLPRAHPEGVPGSPSPSDARLSSGASETSTRTAESSSSSTVRTNRAS